MPNKFSNVIALAKSSLEIGTRHPPIAQHNNTSLLSSTTTLSTRRSAHDNTIGRTDRSFLNGSSLWAPSILFLFQKRSIDPD
ncbi:hypothetical protein V6N13_042840 [Hibiscus sabdariffa]|uniref:Uncharacterized protein n=1 Tax=Hibiscus sabdariffa TaxID=183260 RepID=A0ABR2G4C2_9ROSI